MSTDLPPDPQAAAAAQRRRLTYLIAAAIAVAIVAAVLLLRPAGQAPAPEPPAQPASAPAEPASAPEAPASEASAPEVAAAPPASAASAAEEPPPAPASAPPEAASAAPPKPPAPKAPSTKKPPPPKPPKAPKPEAPPQAAGAPLRPGQLAAAEQVYVGEARCDGNVKVRVQPISGQPGHFQLTVGKARYHMVPEETKTGAVRLEDRKAGVVWLQIPAKSMLLNAKQGRRVADNCRLAEQQAGGDAGAPGLGIQAAPSGASGAADTSGPR